METWDCEMDIVFVLSVPKYLYDVIFVRIELVIRPYVLRRVITLLTYHSGKSKSTRAICHSLGSPIFSRGVVKSLSYHSPG